MKKRMNHMKQSVKRMAEKCRSSVRNRTLSGITVIELVLILVINLIPYFGVDIVCIE